MCIVRANIIPMLPFLNEHDRCRLEDAKDTLPFRISRLGRVNRCLLALAFALSFVPRGQAWAVDAPEPSAVRADPSGSLLQEGIHALESQQLLKARQSFERAYRTSGTSEALYQLGRVAQAEGNKVLAADLFRRYGDLLGGLMDPAVKAGIDAHLAALKQPVCEVRLAAPAGSLLRVDEQLIGRSPLPGAALLIPGQHRFIIETGSSRYVTDTLTIPEGRPVQVNLTPGQKGAAIAIVSLPPAMLLFISGLPKGSASAAMEAIRRTVSAAAAKEQTFLVSSEQTDSLLRNEPAECPELPDCQERVAQKGGVRSIMQVKPVRSGQTPSASIGLVGSEVVVRDVASGQLAARVKFVCDRCTPQQQLERFGRMTGRMIAETNNRPRATLAVSSSPPGSSVYVDGVLVGKTPLERMSLSGSHSVTVSKDGYESAERVVEVHVGRPNELDFKLTAKASAAGSGRHPAWRLAVGGVLAGGGLLTAALGISALSVNGACDETMPSVDGKPCPMIYFTNGVGGGLIGAGIAVTLAGVLLMALPSKTREKPRAAYATDPSAPAFALFF